MIDLILSLVVAFISSLSISIIIGLIHWCDGDNGEIKEPDPSLADEKEDGGGEVEIETPTEAGENNN